MKQGSVSQRLPLWAAYMRAMLLAFIMLLGADWVAYWVWDKWIDWPFLIPFAIAWPIVMTAIT
jgi:uncharacterized membrane protein